MIVEGTNVMDCQDKVKRIKGVPSQIFGGYPQLQRHGGGGGTKTRGVIREVCISSREYIGQGIKDREFEEEHLVKGAKSFREAHVQDRKKMTEFST